MITFGADFNAPAIIGSMQGNHGDGVSAEEANEYLAEALNELGEQAAQRGTFLIYEPLNRYETNLFNRFELPQTFRQPGYLGVRLLHLFHMNIEERDSASLTSRGGIWVCAFCGQQPPAIGCTHQYPANRPNS